MMNSDVLMVENAVPEVRLDVKTLVCIVLMCILAGAAPAFVLGFNTGSELEAKATHDPEVLKDAKWFVDRGYEAEAYKSRSKPGLSIRKERVLQLIERLEVTSQRR